MSETKRGSGAKRGPPKADRSHVVVALPKEAMDALVVLAHSQCRSPTQQAVWIILRALNAGASDV